MKQLSCQFNNEECGYFMTLHGVRYLAIIVIALIDSCYRRITQTLTISLSPLTFSPKLLIDNLPTP